MTQPGAPWLSLVTLATCFVSISNATNYDEAKVGTYTLPDPLVMQDGQRVTTAQQWAQQRRPEIIRLFEENQYGRCPPKPDDLRFDVFDNDPTALDGKAIRKQITVFFNGKPDSPQMHVLMYLPPSAATRPVPVFLCLSFTSVFQITADPGVKITTVWDTKKKATSQPSELMRGRSAKGWPIETVLSRGYGIAFVYYCDIEPDFAGGLPLGVRALYLKPGETDVGPDEWGAVAAWGWGLSRAQDYLETDRQVDSAHTIIMGHSRLGKTVMWAGARDTRFAMTVASCSGEGGAALSRRDYGETVADLNKKFPYQFARNYQKYGEHVDQLPVDSHMLVALMAPRPLYLNTGSEDRWSDPRGEFLAAVAGSPVYELLGKKGIGATEMPPLDTPLLDGDVGYQCHTGKHEVLASDWDRFLDFADRHLRARQGG